MRQETFVKLSVLSLGLILVSFLVRGFSQFLVSSQTASLLSAPMMIGGGSLIVLLTLQSVLAVSGIRPLK